MAIACHIYWSNKKGILMKYIYFEIKDGQLNITKTLITREIKYESNDISIIL